MFIEQKDLDIVKQVLYEVVPQYEVRVFGSRVHGNNLKKYSDIDLVVMTKESLDLSIYSKLKNKFSDSDLPFKVDVVDWTNTNEKFQNIISEKYEIIQNK